MMKYVVKMTLHQPPSNAQSKYTRKGKQKKKTTFFSLVILWVIFKNRERA